MLCSDVGLYLERGVDTMGGEWIATVWFGDLHPKSDVGDPELNMSLCSCTPRSFEAVWVWCINMRHTYPLLEHFHIDMVKEEDIIIRVLTEETEEEEAYSKGYAQALENVLKGLRSRPTSTYTMRDIIASVEKMLEKEYRGAIDILQYEE